MKPGSLRKQGATSSGIQPADKFAKALITKRDFF